MASKAFEEEVRNINLATKNDVLTPKQTVKRRLNILKSR